MDLLHYVIYALRSIFTTVSVEIALTLGVIFFARSLIKRKPIVALPPRERHSILMLLGIVGPLAILVIATMTNWLIMVDPIERVGTWWQRAVPLYATALVVAVAALSLKNLPLPTPGERAVSPRRKWWAFVPRTTLWVTVTVSSLLFMTLAWFTAIGVTMPDGANRYGVGPFDNDGLPSFMRMQGSMGYVWGAGWPNHLATLLAFGMVAVAVVVTLGIDANRPLFSRVSASDVREERTSTARMILLVALSGLLLTLGAVWAHLGFVGSISVSVFENTDGVRAPEQYFIGTGYHDFAWMMHLGGYVVQGLGAAFLLRIIFDTLRSVRATRKNATNETEITPSETTSEASL